MLKRLAHPYLVTVLLGAALPLAFAPWHWFILALIIPGWFERMLTREDNPIRLGFLFGLAFFGIGASWVFVSIHDFSDAPLPIAVIITIGFVSILAAELALFTWIYQKLKATKFISRLMCFPALWALMEAFRGWFLTGFPWLFLGDVFLDTPLIGYAPVLGVFGVSWLAVLMSMLIVRFITQPSLRAWPIYGGVLGIAVLGFILQNIQWTKHAGDVRVVSLVQGNIPQELKWDPDRANQNFLRYYDLTAEALNSDIIIWPEAALPVPMPYGQPYIDAINDLLPEQSAALIGLLHVADEQHHYNAVRVLGDGTGQYNKQHLVPFGEYIPFFNLVGPLFDFLNLPTAFTLPGEHDQDTVRLKNWNAAIMICFEIAFPFLTLDHANNSDVLITVSNDTWFGRSIGPAQHFDMARMRGVEMGRYVIRATNNGISGIITPKGNVLVKAPQFTSTVITQNVPNMRGHTPLMFYGYLPLLFIFVFLICLHLLSQSKNVIKHLC